MITLNLRTLEKQIKEDKLTDNDLVKYFMGSAMLYSLISFYYPFNFIYMNYFSKIIAVLSVVIYVYGIYFTYIKNKEHINFFTKYIPISFLVYLYVSVFYFLIEEFLYLAYSNDFLFGYIPNLIMSGFNVLQFGPILISVATFYFTFYSIKRINKN